MVGKADVDQQKYCASVTGVEGRAVLQYLLVSGQAKVMNGFLVQPSQRTVTLKFDQNQYNPLILET